MEKNMERVRAMLGISFYLYEVGSARAPKGFPWWTAGMKIDPRFLQAYVRLSTPRAIMINFLHFIESYENAQ